ncbi:MAG: glucose-6-phosphate isomerase [Nitrospirae bacterium]|nr:glucose-6-phosphate isomerase [Nitrospirota bacterium]
MNPIELWNRYKTYLYDNRKLGLSLDISRMNFKDGFFDEMKPLIQKAFGAMDDLESGDIANPDEKRMVGHYWLRNPALAPTPELRTEIEETLLAIKSFTKDVHSGKVVSQEGVPFKNILVVGIGGSALGPQFAANAMGSPNDPMTPYFFDNTDPDGMDYVLGQIGKGLSETLAIVISKSGGTVETRNGMLEAKAAYKAQCLDFAKHAVAVTGKGSNLDRTATSESWIRTFPMWDWVGGRTSETSAVGLLPAALQGLDVDAVLAGARLCDEITRTKDALANPSAILALMWYYATNGRGSRDMVILPYKDRMQLFTKYLQQLIMESLGKELDSDGKLVNQGITVYGNKGTTDQHAYIQQLRDGVNNFFVTFVEVLKDRKTPSMQVETDFTTGDYLSAFLLGTRSALYGNNRESMTITIDKIDPFSFGVLVALYERAVGFYASLININAYHQPGVEAGKKEATKVVELQRAVLSLLRNNPSNAYTADEAAGALGLANDVETIFKVLLHVAANPDHKIKQIGDTPLTSSKFQASS